MANDKAHGYLWYPQDILLSRKVKKLSAAEECWYRRALDFAWEEDGLPNDPAEVADMIGKNCTVKAAKMILETFFVVDKKDLQKMRNLKQENLRKRFRKTIKERRKAGKASAAKRAKEKELQERNLVSISSTNAEQTFNNQTKPNQTNYLKTPLPPRKPPAKHEDEINVWLNSIAPLVGAKSRQTMANLARWREVVERAVAEQRDLVQFLGIVKSEKSRNKDSPQFFSPDNCLKILQSTVSPNGNGQGAKPEWQIDIENCTNCDENGRIMTKAEGGGYKAIVCKHK